MVGRNHRRMGKQMIRKFSGRFFNALVLVLVLTMAVPWAAFADSIYNGLDDSVDATLERTNLVGVGSTTIVNLYVQPSGDDNKNGCNFTGSTTLGVSVNSSNTSVATVSPSSLTFGSCGDVKPVTVTSAGAGSATISLTQTSNTTLGTFELATASFTVSVSVSCTAPNAPTFSGTPDGNAGWYKTIPTVSASSTTAGATITYSTDGTTFSSTAPTLGQGSTTVTAKASSGSCSSTSTRTYNVDSVAPAISGSDINNTTWRNTDLAANFTATDGGSGLAVTADSGFTLTASANSTKDADGNIVPTTVSKTVSDVAGNSATRSLSARIDKVAPSANCGSASEGWLGANASIGCTASDALSGLKDATSDASFNLTTSVADGSENANALTNSREVFDNAGNKADAGPIAGNKVDRKAPGYQCGSARDSWGADSDTDASIACTATDGGSGIADADKSFNLTTDVAAGNDTQTAATNTKTLTDSVGNSATAGPITGNWVDKKAPVVTPGNDIDNTTWHNTGLTKDFTADDGTGSGLAAAADASFSLSVTADSTKVNGEVVPTSASKTVADVAGNETTRTISRLIDTAKPTITVSANYSDGTPYTSGSWTNKTVTVSFECSDALSGLATDACPADVVVSSDTASTGQNVSDSVSDRAGNSATSSVINVKVDKTAPSAPTASFNPASAYNDGSYAWYEDSVTVSYAGSTDSGSGVASYSASQTFNTQGLHNYSGTATDNVGNVSAAASGSLKVDNTDPTFGDCVGGPFAKNSGTKTVTITAQDTGGSGIDSAKSIVSGTVDTSTATQKSVTFKAVDNVGHSVEKTCTYDIASTSFHAPINGPSVLNVAKAGRVIPVKVELFLNGTSEVKTGTVTLTTSSTTSGATTTDALETYEDTAAMSGGQFVWDASGDRWMYNLNTSGMALGEYRGNVYLNGKLAGYFLFKLAK